MRSTTGGTDHTREYVPLLVYGKNIKVGVDLGVGRHLRMWLQPVASIWV